MIRRLMCSAAALAVAFAAFAEETEPSWTKEGNVITCFVPAEQEFDATAATYAIKKPITKFIKTGPGTVILSQGSDITAADAFSAEIQEGVVIQKSRGVFGADFAVTKNLVKVFKGAQLRQTFYVNANQNCMLGGVVDYEIEGTGPDNTGALVIDQSSTATDYTYFHDVKLSGDATIYTVNSNGRGIGGKLDLAGHTLTFKSPSYAPIFALGGGRWARKTGVTAITLDRAPDPTQVTFSEYTTVTPGNIVLDSAHLALCGDLRFVEGGDYSSSTITMKTDKFKVIFERLINPCPFGFVLDGASQIFRITDSVYGGVAYPDANTVLGNIHFKKSSLNLEPSDRISAANPGVLHLKGDITAEKTGTGEDRYQIYHQQIINDHYANITTHLYGNNTCDINVYTGKIVAHKDGAFGYRYLSLSSKYDTGMAEFILGDDACSEAYVVESMGTAASWQGDLSTNGRIALYTETNIVFSADIPAFKSTIRYTHTGPGTLTFAGSLPAQNSFIQGETNRTVFGGAKDQSVAYLYQTRGSIEVDKTAGTFSVTKRSDLHSGFIQVSGGTLKVPTGSALYIAADSGDRSSLHQTGGTLVSDGGRILRVSGGGDADYLMRGGTLQSNGNLYLGEKYYSNVKTNAGEQAVLSLVGQEALVQVNGQVILNERDEGGFVSVLNLVSGVFQGNVLRNGADNSTRGPCYVNFNGGTLSPMSSSGQGDGNLTKNPLFGSTVYAPTAITVWRAVFDVPAAFSNAFSSSGNSCHNESMCVRSPTGRGVLKITLPDGMPREGYLDGVRPVRIVGGGGTCCTASLDYDDADHTVKDEMLVTCPGWDYTDAPTVTAYGPDGVTEYACTATLTDEPQDGKAVIVKTGEGRLDLNTTNFVYSGTIIVSNGMLRTPARMGYNNPSAVPSKDWHFKDTTLLLAGGTYCGDWFTRTFKGLGGFGTVIFSFNNSRDTLNVSDALHFDGEDLAQERKIVLHENGYEKDNISFANGVKLHVANPQALADSEVAQKHGRVVLIESQAGALGGTLPTVEVTDPVMQRWKLRFSQDKKKLILHGLGAGLTIIVR